MKDVDLPKSPLLVTAIQLGLLVFAIYYTFIGGQTAQGIYDHTWRSITLWLTMLMSGLWLLWRLASRHKIPRTPLDGPLLFLLLAWIAATFFSIDRVYSQETLVFFINYLFFFYMAADLGRRPWFTELSFNALIGVSGLVWTLALLQLSWWYRDYAGVPDLLQAIEPGVQLPRLSVLGNPNTMASYIALVLPIVVYKLSVVRKLATRILLGVWLVMLAGAILLTQSRGGWLALMTAVSFYSLGWLWPGIPYKSFPNYFLNLHKLAVQRDKWIIGVVGVVGVGVFAWLMVTLRGVSEGVDIRREVMAGAVKTLLHHPIFGAGPGVLGEELVRHQKPLGVIWADAHNLFLTLAAETGLVGAIGLGWLGVVCFGLIKAMFRPGNGSQASLARLACAAALLGFMAHNMVDSFFKFPLLMMTVAILSGFWVSSSLSLTSYSLLPTPSLLGEIKGWPYPVTGAAVLAVIITLMIGVGNGRHLKSYNEAVAAAGRGDWQGAVEYLRVAYQLAPGTPFYQQQLAFALGRLSQQEPASRPEAIAHYRAALGRVDQLAVDHANLGCLLWAEGGRAEAIQEMRLARALDPYKPIYGLNLGYFLELAGEGAAARAEYARLLAIWPDYIQSDYWFEREERAAMLPEILQLAGQDLVGGADVLTLIQLHLERQDVETARQVYERYLRNNTVEPISQYLGKGKILFSQGDFVAARTEFETALQVEARTAEAYLYLSQLALARQDIEGAKAQAEAALFLSPTPAAFYQSGLAAAAAGDTAGAIEQYEAAFAQLTTQTDPAAIRYATEVARRRPLPESYLPCLRRVYPTRLLAAISQAEGVLLEKQGEYEWAGQVYRRLVSY